MQARGMNPFHMRVRASDTHTPIGRARKLIEPIAAEHMEGFGAALERGGSTPEVVRAHQMLRVGTLAFRHAREVADVAISNGRLNLFGINPMELMAQEATVGYSTLQTNIVDFITQAIHMQLDQFPRLIAPRLVSTQPFTQPSGYVFYQKRLDQDGNDLSVLANHDPDYSLRTTEGSQVKAIKMQLTSELVEIEWHALMGQFSHEVDVQMRSQHNLDVQTITDMMVADQLDWNIDRKIIDGLVTFAATNPRGVKEFDATKSGTYDSLVTSEQREWDRTFLTVTLAEAMNEMAKDIHSYGYYL